MREGTTDCALFNSGNSFFESLSFVADRSLIVNIPKTMADATRQVVSRAIKYGFSSPYVIRYSLNACKSINGNRMSGFVNIFFNTKFIYFLRFLQASIESCSAFANLKNAIFSISNGLP